MIAVCGEVAERAAGGVSATEIARRAVTAGSFVQLVAIVPDDPEGDRRLLELAAAGVGHAAVLRGPNRPLEAADVDLALRYLADVRVVIAIGLEAGPVATAAERAAWSGATLLVVVPSSRTAAGAGTAVAADLPSGAFVLEAPRSDPEGTFAGFVGTLAAGMDAGASPADSWALTTRALAVDPA